MDRAVKIWRVPMVQYEKVNVNEEHLAREDKPLFSTDLMHDSRVLSVAWYAFSLSSSDGVCLRTS